MKKQIKEEELWETSKRGQVEQGSLLIGCMGKNSVIGR